MKLQSGTADPSDRPRIATARAGPAGLHYAHTLDRHLGSTAELIPVNPVDHVHGVDGVDERYATIQSEATGGSAIRAVRTVDASAA